MKRLGLVIVVLIAISGTMAAVMRHRIREPYWGYPGTEQFVEIPPGTGTRAIGERLVAAGVVRDLLTYRIAIWISGQARSLKAGEYRFGEPMTPVDVIRKIARGDVYAINVTFPE